MSATDDRKEICKSLKIDVRTLDRWRKLEGAPTGYDMQEWQEFRVANGLGRDPTKTKTQLQEDKLRREIKLADLKIAREEGLTVAVTDVREFLAQLAAKHSQLLRTKYDTELPAKLQGKDIVGIRRQIIATTDEVAETVNRGLMEWTPSA